MAKVAVAWNGSSCWHQSLWPGGIARSEHNGCRKKHSADRASGPRAARRRAGNREWWHNRSLDWPLGALDPNSPTGPRVRTPLNKIFTVPPTLLSRADEVIE